MNVAANLQPPPLIANRAAVATTNNATETDINTAADPIVIVIDISDDENENQEYDDLPIPSNAAPTNLTILLDQQRNGNVSYNAEKSSCNSNYKKYDDKERLQIGGLTPQLITIDCILLTSRTIAFNKRLIKIVLTLFSLM
ncbi:hypothetical protein BJV82DRAFT_574901 [Fennellomyces sp. T-0311]|nr:hypothetical protein BJV82DRAFT_574901 [Fennellomyces sp. T-0311]